MRNSPQPPQRASGSLQTSELTVCSCHLIFQGHILFIEWPQLLADLSPPAFPSPEPLIVVFAVFHYVIQACHCKAPNREKKHAFVKFLFVNNCMNFKELKVRLAGIEAIKLLSEISWFLDFFILVIVPKYFWRKNKPLKSFNSLVKLLRMWQSLQWSFVIS